MGQYWKVVNIDRKEQLLNNGGLKLWGMLVSGCMEQLVEPHAETELDSSQNRGPSPPSGQIEQTHLRVSSTSHSHVSSSSDSSARNSREFWQKTRRRAGDRLIFVGDYAGGLDVGRICTSDELLEFEEDKEIYGDNPLYRLADNRVMCTEDEYANSRQQDFEGDDVRRPGALEERVKEKLTFNGLSLFNRLATLAKRPQSTTDRHRTHAAVLRNLTAKQYVRDDAIAESDYAYSLGEVVAVFTTWTDDGSGLQGLEGQALWAGHRFDIATMADVSEDGWTDVSELAVENLWKATEQGKKEW